MTTQIICNLILLVLIVTGLVLIFKQKNEPEKVKSFNDAFFISIIAGGISYTIYSFGGCFNPFTNWSLLLLVSILISVITSIARYTNTLKMNRVVSLIYSLFTYYLVYKTGFFNDLINLFN